MKDAMRRLIKAAQQPEEADLIIQNGTVVDVFSLETFKADVAVKDGTVVGIGTYPKGKQIVDASGKYVLPGFIDGHIHIESTMVTPSEFSRALIKHGVTTVVTDPHEIANVAGRIGIDFMLEDAANADMDILMKLPSCVPATPFEQNGATLTADDLRPYLSQPSVIGLAEVMDYPSVLHAEPDMLEKINMTTEAGLRIDGHAAGLPDAALNVYSTAGIRNDHEAVTAEEAIARVRRGIHVLVREGSAAKDLLALLPAINERNSTRFSFCTDDKHLDELAEEGTVNYAAQLAIQNGLDPLIAIQMATINNAVCHGIKDKGAIAPGYLADILITDSLETLQPDTIIKDGRVLDLAALNTVRAVVPQSVKSSINLKKVTKDSLQIPLQKGQKAWVIGVVPGRIITDKITADVKIEDGFFVPDPERDQLKMVVCERHHATGNIGVGIVSGLGLKRGAIASTVAHDSHNLVVAGTNDGDMLLAIAEAQRIQGGLVIVDNGKVLASVPLRVGGIMSEKPYEEVIAELHQLHEQLATITETAQNVFMILSFLCLPVIPRLKLTDKGLFDVDSFRHVAVGLPI
ncbi:amidohydrolase 1 [Trichococcus palustris]|uniref:Adenine deaminase n=1 Tax=Trichococcus palustris TaxID=140314 RepID=A0A143YG98_9LACT|nr:adenine deaminase [Trichococcus palustris]CZQ89289.1 amidohydrolase 1 [Trichococcus palustris]SFL11025.1 Adenine deaminase [Trichococcus palustris]